VAERPGPAVPRGPREAELAGLVLALERGALRVAEAVARAAVRVALPRVAGAV